MSSFHVWTLVQVVFWLTILQYTRNNFRRRRHGRRSDELPLAYIMATFIRLCGMRMQISAGFTRASPEIAPLLASTQSVKCKFVSLNPTHGFSSRYRQFHLRSGPNFVCSKCSRPLTSTYFKDNFRRALCTMRRSAPALTSSTHFHANSYAAPLNNPGFQNKFSLGLRPFSSSGGDQDGSSDAAASSGGSDEGDSGGESEGEMEMPAPGFAMETTLPALQTVPEVWPKVPVIAVRRHPVFPRFTKIIEVCIPWKLHIPRFIRDDTFQVLNWFLFLFL